MRPLVDSRYNIEIDWAGHRVCAAYARSGEGLVDVVHAVRCQLVAFVGCPRKRWDLV